MSLDILSPKGQVSASDEMQASALLTRRYPRLTYVDTPKDRPAAVDAVIMLDGTVYMLAETKCRYDCDLSKFRNQYDNKWLVTFDKIMKARELAMSMSVPLMGMLYIVKDKTLLLKQITDSKGGFTSTMTIETTKTQATINGGVAYRTNAFIDMRDAKVICETNS